MNVARLFRQSATLERRTTTDAYDGHAYATPVSIAVRWFTDNAVVLSDDRREVTSNARLSTLAVINPGDRVTDEAGRKREVIQVRLNRSTRGAFSHYVAYLQ